MENITQTQKVLAHKVDAIPDLEDALQEASARFDEARKAREQKHKADELKKELAWAHVAAKQLEYESKLLDKAKGDRKVEKIQKSIDEAQVTLQVGSLLDVGVDDDYRHALMLQRWSLLNASKIIRSWAISTTSQNVLTRSGLRCVLTRTNCLLSRYA